jgi:tight adherence protein B
LTVRPHDLVVLEATLPAVAAQVGRDLRTGASLLDALDRAARSVDGPLRADLDRVVGATRRGVPLAVVLDGWRRARRSEPVSLFVVACRFVHRHGGVTAPALDGVATALTDRLEVADEIRSLTAQARLSAWVLASLPVAGTVGFSLLDPGVARVLLTTPAGWACLVVGGAMELTGVAVIRRLVGGVAT